MEFSTWHLSPPGEAAHPRAGTMGRVWNSPNGIHVVSTAACPFQWTRTLGRSRASLLLITVVGSRQAWPWQIGSRGTISASGSPQNFFRRPTWTRRVVMLPLVAWSCRLRCQCVQGFWGGHRTCTQACCDPWHPAIWSIGVVDEAIPSLPLRIPPPCLWS
jgi:hypothetical protein